MFGCLTVLLTFLVAKSVTFRISVPVIWLLISLFPWYLFFLTQFCEVFSCLSHQVELWGWNSGSNLLWRCLICFWGGFPLSLLFAVVHMWAFLTADWWSFLLNFLSILLSVSLYCLEVCPCSRPIVNSFNKPFCFLINFFFISKSILQMYIILSTIQNY